MEQIFVKSLLRDKVKIKPANLTPDIENVILQILRDKYEGRCSYHGYVRSGSIVIDKCSTGYVQAFSLNGDVIYNVSYFAEVCNPAIGLTVPVKVVNMNKFGILAEAYSRAKGLSTPVLEVIIAKSMINIENEVPLDTVNVGDIINIEIIGKKFELNDKKISVVGRTVVNLNVNVNEGHKKAVVAPPHDDEDNVDDAESDEVVSSSDEENDEDNEDEEVDEESDSDDEEDVTEAEDDLGSDADFDEDDDISDADVSDAD